MDERTVVVSDNNLAINSDNPRKRIQQVPGVNKVQSWLLNSFKGDANNEIPTTIHGSPASPVYVNPILRSLQDVGGIACKEDDDSSVDTTSYIKLNRTVTRMQKNILKHSSPVGILLANKGRSPEPPFVKSGGEVANKTICPVLPSCVAAKRKRLVKYSSSVNLRLKRLKHRSEEAQSSTSSDDEADGDIAALRSGKRLLTHARKRLRHDSV